jgi:LPXTG-motif cell wall-anchored protein
VVKSAMPYGSQPGSLPQTATPAMLQLLLGLLALAAGALVAFSQRSRA